MTLTRLESFPFDSRYDGFDDEGYPVYDRAVGARTMRDVFAHFFSDGVFSDTTYPFRLTKAASGLAVTVNPGVIIINGGWGILPEATTLTLATGTTAGVVKYAVFARYDNNDEHRTIYLRTDASSAGGAVPEPSTTEANVTEYRIGYITVPSNSSNLTNATITNEVGTSKCPYAVPLFDIDPAEVLEDLRQDAQAAYDKYYELLQSALDGTTAGRLQAQIDANTAAIAELEENQLTEEDLDAQKLRANMGLGNTLGVLQQEYGGTGTTSLAEAIKSNTGARFMSYGAVTSSEFEESALVSFYDPNALSVGSYGFNKSLSLVSVELPECISVGDYAFQECSSLETVDIPKCTSIGAGAFLGASGGALIFPKCTSIGMDAFRKFDADVVDLPLVSTLPGGAFYELKTRAIKLPSCSKAEDNFVFRADDGTEPVYIHLGGSTLSLKGDSLSLASGSMALVPSGSVFDLHGVSQVECEYSGWYASVLFAGSQEKYTLWVDAGVPYSSALLVFSRTTTAGYMPKIDVYTNASSSWSGLSNLFQNCDVTYHYGQNYSTWLATYGK